MEKEELTKLLNTEEVRGRIIKDAAFLDFSMEMAIGFYFSTYARFSTFEQLVVTRLGFEDKLQILEQIPYEKQYKCLISLKTLRHIQRVRNIVAHTHHVSGREGKLNNPEWAYLFENWPDTYQKVYMSTKLGLDRLSRTKEFFGSFISCP